MLFSFSLFWWYKHMNCWMFYLSRTQSSLCCFYEHIILRTSSFLPLRWSPFNVCRSLAPFLLLCLSLSPHAAFIPGLFLRSLKYSLPALTDRLMHSAHQNGKSCLKSLLWLSRSLVEVSVFIIFQVGESTGLKSTHYCLRERLFATIRPFMSVSLNSQCKCVLT